MGKTDIHKLSKRASMSPSVSKTLLKQQRGFESEFRLRLLGLVLLLGVVLVQVSLMVWPPTPSLTTSQRSDLITGGVPSDQQQAIAGLLQSFQNPFNAAVYDYYSIEPADFEIGVVEELRPSDDDYYVVSRYRSGQFPESQHLNRGFNFYDKPWQDTVINADVPRRVLIGEQNTASNLNTTGRQERWFAVDLASGNLIINKSRDAVVQTRLFSDWPTIEADQLVRFAAEIKSVNGASADFEELRLELPEYASLSFVNGRTIDSSSSEVIIDPSRSGFDQLGGNQAAWLDLGIYISSAAPNGAEICPNLVATTLNHTELHSDVQCTFVADSGPSIDSRCEQQTNNNFHYFGDRADSSDSDCNLAFAGAVRNQLGTAFNNGSLTVVVEQRNYGLQDDQRLLSLDLSDALEYASLLPNEQPLEDEALNWPLMNLRPNQSSVYKLDLLIPAELASTARSTNDSDSFDSVISLSLDNTNLLRLDTNADKLVEEISTQTNPINNLAIIVGIFFVALGAGASALQTGWAMHAVKHVRRENSGGIH